MREPWFDPEGFFLAQRLTPLASPGWSGSTGPRCTAGTSIPTGCEGHEVHGHEPMGEVYVVGVDPGEQGNGLGRALTLLGLTHLRGRGLTEAMLYVDADNTRAIALYQGLGFAHWDTDRMYQRTHPPRVNNRRLPRHNGSADATMKAAIGGPIRGTEGVRGRTRRQR